MYWGTAFYSWTKKYSSQTLPHHLLSCYSAGSHATVQCKYKWCNDNSFETTHLVFSVLCCVVLCTLVYAKTLELICHPNTSASCFLSFSKSSRYDYFQALSQIQLLSCMDRRANMQYISHSTLIHIHGAAYGLGLWSSRRFYIILWLSVCVGNYSGQVDSDDAVTVFESPYTTLILVPTNSHHLRICWE